LKERARPRPFGPKGGLQSKNAQFKKERKSARTSLMPDVKNTTKPGVGKKKGEKKQVGHKTETGQHKKEEAAAAKEDVGEQKQTHVLSICSHSPAEV